MSLIESRLLAFCQANPNENILVAYSGGVDSQVLLTVLAKLQQQHLISNKIAACHVNHGLSTNADAWQLFAQQQCKRADISLTVCELNLKKLAQESLEATARDARYQALIQCQSHPSIIVTGHHLDDQAETLLLALKRGAGLKGMSAMSAESTLAQHKLARPLLSVSRSDIISYANQQQLEWVEDESNQDEQFDRNFIRQSIMPLMTARWPSIASTLSRSAQHAQHAQELLDEIAQADLAKVKCTPISLSVPELLQLTEQRFYNVIRHFLSLHNKLMPSAAQLSQLLCQLSASEDKNPAIKVTDYYLRRYKSQLYLTPCFDDIHDWFVNINEQSTIALPDDLGNITIEYPLVGKDKNVSATEQINYFFSSTHVTLIAPSAGQKVSIRFHHQNPKCLPHYRDKPRALKKILQEANIPTWQRQRIPFVYYDDVLVAALGIFVCKNHLPYQDDALCKLVWRDRV